jgi:hypothetical protein
MLVARGWLQGEWWWRLQGICESAKDTHPGSKKWWDEEVEELSQSQSWPIALMSQLRRLRHATQVLWMVETVMVSTGSRPNPSSHIECGRWDCLSQRQKKTESRCGVLE